MTLELKLTTDEPVLVLVIPLRKAAPRSVPPMPAARQIVDTTAEELPEAALREVG